MMVIWPRKNRNLEAHKFTHFSSVFDASSIEHAIHIFMAQNMETK